METLWSAEKEAPLRIQVLKRRLEAPACRRRPPQEERFHPEQWIKNGERRELLDDASKKETAPSGVIIVDTRLAGQGFRPSKPPLSSHTKPERLEMHDQQKMHQKRNQHTMAKVRGTKHVKGLLPGSVWDSIQPKCWSRAKPILFTCLDKVGLQL
jgi:hypothetical protein